MIFRQHIPSFVDGAESEIIKFNTTEELLNSELFQRYKNPDSSFVKDDNKIMEIHDDGYHWWVVGFVDQPDKIDLPKWDGWKFRAELKDGRKVVLSKEVVMSSGDILTLRDGSTAKNLRL